MSMDKIFMDMWNDQINEIINAAVDFKKLYGKAENAELPTKLMFLKRIQLLAGNNFKDVGEE